MFVHQLQQCNIYTSSFIQVLSINVKLGHEDPICSQLALDLGPHLAGLKEASVSAGKTAKGCILKSEDESVT